MPQIIKNDAGEDVEVFTKEELEAAAAAKATEVESAKQAEYDNLVAEKAKAEAELEKLRNKDMNFENLRNKVAGKEGEVEATQKKIDELSQKLDQFVQQPVNDTKEEFIQANIGNDKDKKDLFEYYFKRLGSEAKTKAEVLKAAKEALTLAGGGIVQPSNDGRVTSTGISQNYRNQSSGEPSAESKAMGAKLGVTEEDRKKYGPKQ